MANSEASFEVKRNDAVGRYLVATDDIQDGEIIFSEEPIMLGPKRFSLPICLGCHHSVDGSYFCTKCGFAMCSTACENIRIHADQECKIFAKKGSKPKKLSSYDTPQPLYQCILPLRLLLLRKSDQSKWEKLMVMEHHSEIRKSTSKEDWYMNDVNIVQFLRGWLGMDEYDAEIIHQVIGAIEVNCFHVQNITGIEVSGMYENGSILMQDCVPNTHHAFTPDCKLIFRSSFAISKGQPITMSYAPLLSGTIERRQMLKATKYFDCICNRCADPTEERTFLSAIKCLHCPIGYMLPEYPLQADSPWACYSESDNNGIIKQNDTCRNQMAADTILSNLNEMKKAIQKATASAANSAQAMENLYKTYADVFLHPNHFLLIPVLQDLNRLLNNNTDNGKITSSDLRDKVAPRILKVLDKLQPGLSRSRGILLYQMNISKLEEVERNHKTGHTSSEEHNLEMQKLRDAFKLTNKIFKLDEMIGVTNSRNFELP